MVKKNVQPALRNEQTNPTCEAHVYSAEHSPTVFALWTLPYIQTAGGNIHQITMNILSAHQEKKEMQQI